MAKIEKIKKGTATIYPATIPQAVVDPTSGKSAREELDEKADHGYDSAPKTLKEVDEAKVDKTSIVGETGQGETSVMHQKAVTDELGTKAAHGYESSPKTLKQVDDSVSQLAGEVSVKVRSLITNGDFVDDINGWSGSGGTMSVEHDSGRLRAYNWSTTASRIVSPAMEGLSIGDLLYLRIGEYERSAMPTSSNLIRASINDTAPDIINVLNNPNLIIKNLSGIAAYNGQIPQIHIRTYQGAGNSVWVNDVVCINLTATFGAGNEPTKEEFELLLSTLGMDYFEGEIIIPAQKIMQWQLKLIRKNKNAIIALGGTII